MACWLAAGADVGGKIAREGPSLRTASVTITTAAPRMDATADKSAQRARDRLISKAITPRGQAQFRVCCRRRFARCRKDDAALSASAPSCFRRPESAARALPCLFRAPVAQWIEQRFPKPRAQVQFLSGAPAVFRPKVRGVSRTDFPAQSGFLNRVPPRRASDAITDAR
jgi:hypothetical protein